MIKKKIGITFFSETKLVKKLNTTYLNFMSIEKNIKVDENENRLQIFYLQPVVCSVYILP